MSGMHHKALLKEYKALLRKYRALLEEYRALVTIPQLIVLREPAVSGIHAATHCTTLQHTATHCSIPTIHRS